MYASTFTAIDSPGSSMLNGGLIDNHGLHMCRSSNLGTNRNVAPTWPVLVTVMVSRCRVRYRRSSKNITLRSMATLGMQSFSHVSSAVKYVCACECTTTGSGGMK